MKILFLNAYFYPENISFSHLESDLMKGLMDAGHELTVVCPTPSRGVSEEIYQKYKNIKKENVNGIAVQRDRAPREGKNPVIRAFRYFWCNFRGNQIAKRYKDTDVVFADSTPPTQGLFAGKLAKKLDVPFVYSLQDLFPDTLLTSGLMKRKSFLYRVGLRIEKKTYKSASKIIVISETMHRILLQKGVPEEKLLTVSNWIDVDRTVPVPKEKNTLFGEFGIDKNKFIVVYAGNFGNIQGTQVIVETAELLKDDPDIFFAIFGLGTDYEKCKEYIRQNDLNNIRMYPLQPIERVSEVYSLGDVALVTCRKGTSKTVMPSKVWSIMACNTPIVASFDTDSELADIIKECSAGIVVEPENPQALAHALRKTCKAKAENSMPVSGSREYVTAHASSKICVGKYVDCIKSAAE